MLGLGDAAVLLLSTVALIYGLYMMIARKLPLYFQLSTASEGCLLLGYLFDVCDYLVNGYHGDGYLIGYLGSIGSFLFLLAASVGYMDGIMDDGSAPIKKCRYIDRQKGCGSREPHSFLRRLSFLPLFFPKSM